MLWSKKLRQKVKNKKAEDKGREIHIKCCWEHCMPTRLSVCVSVCLLSLENPSTQSQTTTELMPTPYMHTHRRMHTHIHTHSGLFYPTLLICTPLFIRKKDSKATRSSETLCVCVYAHAACMCVSRGVNVWSRELCKQCLVISCIYVSVCVCAFLWSSPLLCNCVCVYVCTLMLICMWL